jgi:hypothetical protein
MFTRLSGHAQVGLANNSRSGYQVLGLSYDLPSLLQGGHIVVAASPGRRQMRTFLAGRRADATV